MKTYLLIGLIGLGLSVQSAYAKDKNICDKLIEENRASDQAINDCFKRMGKSDYRKDLEKKLKIEQDERQNERQQIARLRDLLEKRQFSEEEIKEEFFEQTVIMTKTHRNDPTDEDYIFDADRVCEYLGYAKATKVVVPDMHGEIWAEDAKSVNGITLNSSLQMKDYDPFFNNHLVKPLKGITCHRTTDGSKEALELLPESAVLDNSGGRDTRIPRDDETRVDDSSRNYRPREPQYDRYNSFTSGLSEASSR